MFGVLSFPGTNCELESKRALERAGIKAEIYRWNEDKEVLKKLDGFLIAGGFSFEDRGRSGIIASLEPVIETLREESVKGKPVIGVCNGAQILVESGLVTDSNGARVSLSENKRINSGGDLVGTGFYNTWTYLKPTKAKTAFNNFKESIHIPLAHAEGRFLIPKEEQKNVQVVFQYATEKGEVKNSYPVNPNGSFENAAAISNKRGNVLAIMPHPERTEKGDLIFKSLAEFLRSGRKEPLIQDLKEGEKVEVKNKEKFDLELFIKLKITDNEAVSIGKAAKIENLKKHKFIGINLKNSSDLKKIEELIEIGEFHNSQKEILEIKKKSIFNFFKKSKFKDGIRVRFFDDVDSLEILEIFERHGISAEVKTGTLWTGTEEKFEIFANPVAQFIEK